MHKTTRIHIAKIPYDIEPEAEAALKQYLAALRSALGADGAKDTMTDIELHITEILKERGVPPNGVITSGDLQAIKTQLGDPKQVKDGRTTSDVRQNTKSNGRRTVWLSVLTAIVVLVGASLIMWNDRIFPGPISNLTERQEYSRQVTKLQVNVESGNVEVRSGKAAEVILEREYKWAGDKPTFKEEWSGETLRITTNCPDNQNNCSLGYVVYVPDTTVVDVRTDDGAIEMGDIAGNIRLQTSAGDIDVTNAKGAVWAKASDGNITVFGQSSTVEAQTSSGNVDLRFSTAPTLVTAKAASGNVEVVVPFGDTYAVQATTSSGQRTVAVQQDSASKRQIQAQTSSGNVTVQYPQN